MLCRRPCLYFVYLLLLSLSSLTAPLRAGVTLTETVYPVSDSPARAHAVDFLSDQYGYLWVATWDGLLRFDGYDIYSFKSYISDEAFLETNRLLLLYNNPDKEEGGIWCRTYDNTYSLFNNTTCRFTSRKFHAEEDTLSGLRHQTFEETNAMYRWLNLLPRPILAQHSPYSGELTPIKADLKRTYLDPEGNFWSSYAHRGFCMLSTNHSAFDFIDHGRTQHVRALLHDRHERLWVALQNPDSRAKGHILLYDTFDHCLGSLTHEGNIVPVKEGEDLVNFGSSTYCFFEDSHGNIWLGGRLDGLYVLVPKDDEGSAYNIYHYPSEPDKEGALFGNSVYHITEDRFGHVWVASHDGGLNLVVNPSDPAHLTIYNSQHGLTGYPYPDGRRSRHIIFTHDDKLIVCTDHGLFCSTIHFDQPSDLQFHHHQTEARATALSSNYVMYGIETRLGDLVLCTNGGGLNIADASSVANILTDTLTFRHYDCRNTYLTDAVYSVYETNDNRLLILSENSLAYYQPDLTLSEICMEGVETCEMPTYVHNDDEFWIATLDDLLHFDRRSRSAGRPAEHQVQFTHVLARSVKGERSFPLAPADTVIQFTDAERDITLRFSALDLTSPKNIQYRYRLDNETFWQPLGFNHEVHFSKFKAGTHRIEVSSTNRDGEWLDNTAALTLVFQPHFYEYQFFPFVLIGILILLFLLIYRVAARTARR